MQQRTVRIARLWGVDVNVDPSWVFIALLVAWSFWSRFATGPQRHPVGVAILMALAATVLFFASVLAHEVAHALEARHRGVRVAGITLYVFGGATTTTTEPARPVDEFVLTALGPYTSLVLGAGFGLVAFGADRAGLGDVGQVAGLLGWLNLGLGAFNLLPGAPLDGGRMLESVVWRVTGDRLRGKLAAAGAGRFLGAVLVGAGVFESFVVVGGFVQGLWLAFIGWILLKASAAEGAQAELRTLLGGRPARTLLSADSEAVEGTASVGWLIAGPLRHQHLDAVPVRDDGHIVGVLHIDDIVSLPADRRAFTTASELMTPVADVPHLDADADALQLVDALAADGARSVAVTDHGETVGVVTPRQLLATVERLSMLQRGRRRLSRR